MGRRWFGSASAGASLSLFGSKEARSCSIVARAWSRIPRTLPDGSLASARRSHALSVRGETKPGFWLQKSIWLRPLPMKASTTCMRKLLSYLM